jgi:SAM-dependent methyltransferase
VNTEPQTWHYGLVARWWAEFNTDGPEIDFFRSFIVDGGAPALDAACGTGRLLVPYLRDGLDVDGCDISADMLVLCRASAARHELTPNLFRQALHELDLPRSYETVIVCGSFGLGGQRSQDQQALGAIRRHLNPGGRLVFDIGLPYADAQDWSLWLPENRAQLPQPWPRDGRRKQAVNGDEIEICTRISAFDPLQQAVTWQIRATLLQDGREVSQEEHRLRAVLYFRNELVDMLAHAGFGEIAVLDGYTHEPAKAESTTLTFVATR